MKHLVKHKSTFIWNDNKGKYEVTVCGVVNHNQVIDKTEDWSNVTCSRCLRAKENFKISNVNLA
jgi:hypothetical protein